MGSTGVHPELQKVHAAVAAATVTVAHTERFSHLDLHCARLPELHEITEAPLTGLGQTGRAPFGNVPGQRLCPWCSATGAGLGEKLADLVWTTPMTFAVVRTTAADSPPWAVALDEALGGPVARSGAVEIRRGPHFTPIVFSQTAMRWWAMGAASGDAARRAAVALDAFGGHLRGGDGLWMAVTRPAWMSSMGDAAEIFAGAELDDTAAAAAGRILAIFVDHWGPRLELAEVAGDTVTAVEDAVAAGADQDLLAETVASLAGRHPGAAAAVVRSAVAVIS